MLLDPALVRAAYNRPDRSPIQGAPPPPARRQNGATGNPPVAPEVRPGLIPISRNAPQLSRYRAEAPYPKPIGEEGYYGISGEVVRLIEPHTEADPNFLLVSFLVMAGNVLGRKAHIWVGGDKHFTNLFAVGVGPTSTGRKGSAAGPLDLFFSGIDEDWCRNIQPGGLSSGEGLIWAVRNPIKRKPSLPETGQRSRRPNTTEELEDPGVTDKRLLVRQSEFFGALSVMRRAGNTLSPVIRDAWDRGDLSSITKHSPARATGAHISILGNITKEELLRTMVQNEAENGLANRFLWCCSRRSRALPDGGRLYTVDFRPLQRRFEQASIESQNGETMRRDSDAADLWGRDENPRQGLYVELTRDRPGLYGDVTARAAAQVLRLSLVYAVLDRAQAIRKEHLLAAEEVWRYCDESARFIFGDSLGDATADALLDALRGAPNGLTRMELINVFGRNKSGPEISRALGILQRSEKARMTTEKTNGRPAERWLAV